MKTTIELPDHLFRRAKILAAQRKTTLKNLVIEGLEAITSRDAGTRLEELTPEEAEFMELDAHGVPVLRRDRRPKAKVTNDAIDALREELGV